MKYVSRCLSAWTLTVLVGSALPVLPETTPADAQALETIGAAFQKNDLDAAEKAAETAVARSPNSSELHMWLGRVYGQKAISASVFKQMALASKCHHEFEKAVALDPKNVDARWDLMNYYVQAPGIAGGSNEKAKLQAGEILKLDPVRGHLARGSLADREKNVAVAEAEYKKAAETDPKSSRSPVYLSNFYLAQKRFDDAREIWLKSLKADPEDGVAHYQLAKAALISGQELDGGVQHLKTYLSAPAKPETPTHADAHWRLGLLYEKQGKKDAARAEIKEALKMNPAHVQAKKDLKRLES